MLADKDATLTLLHVVTQPIAMMATPAPDISGLFDSAEHWLKDVVNETQSRLRAAGSTGESRRSPAGGAPGHLRRELGQGLRRRPRRRGLPPRPFRPRAARVVRDLRRLPLALRRPSRAPGIGRRRRPRPADRAATPAPAGPDPRSRYHAHRGYGVSLMPNHGRARRLSFMSTTALPPAGTTSHPCPRGSAPSGGPARRKPRRDARRPGPAPAPTRAGTRTASTSDVDLVDRRRQPAIDALQLFLGQMRDIPLLTASRGDRAGQADRGRRRRAPGSHGPEQPALGRRDRQALSRPGSRAARPDPGRRARTHPRGRALRLAPRPQILDLRHLVDPPGRPAGSGRRGTDDPPSDPRGRTRARGHARRA